MSLQTFREINRISKGNPAVIRTRKEQTSPIFYPCDVDIVFARREAGLERVGPRGERRDVRDIHRVPKACSPIS